MLELDKSHDNEQSLGDKLAGGRKVNYTFLKKNAIKEAMTRHKIKINKRKKMHKNNEPKN